MDYKNIKEEIIKTHLSNAFPAIKEKAHLMNNWSITEDVESLWSTYCQMMQFMLNGVNDPKAGDMILYISKKLFALATKMERQERILQHNADKYTSTLKSLKNTSSFESIVNLLEQISENIQDIKASETLRDNVRQYNLDKLEAEHEDAITKLFNWVWTSEPWNNNDVNLANRTLYSDNISNDDKAVFISAITLSILEYSDEAKLLFLLDCYLHEDIQISQRALIGFVLSCCDSQPNMYSQNGEITNRLAIYREDSEFIKDLYSTFTLLQFSCTTDKVTSKMRLDILPTIMQDNMKKMNKDIKEIDINELTKNGENPEWVDEEKLNQKVREMSELQLDGADVHFSSFSMLKSFSFFSTMSHWFYPFSTDNPAVSNLYKSLKNKFGSILSLMFNNPMFCNSDRYSICFTIQNISNYGESMVESQINSQLAKVDNIDEIIEDSKNNKPQKIDIRRHYIFDLYRFYHLYPSKAQFANPFVALKKTPITPYDALWQNLGLAENEDSNANYAEFLMRNEFYAEALKMFKYIAKNEFEEHYASIWQKIGFCCQKLNMVDDAFQAYTVANNLKPNSKWTLTHLASMAAHMKDYKEALKHYTALIDMDPDNTKYINQAATMMMNINDFQNALTLFYKAHFLDEENKETKFNIAWCSIACNENEKAMRFVLQGLAENTNSENDRLLYAIVMLVEGKHREAYNFIKDLSSEKKEQLKEMLSTLVFLNIIPDSTSQLFFDALTLHIE